MGSNKGKNRNKYGGIVVLTIAGFLFLFCGLGYGKYIYDGGDPQELSEMVAGLLPQGSVDSEEESAASEQGTELQSVYDTEPEASTESVYDADSLDESGTEGENGLTAGVIRDVQESSDASEDTEITIVMIGDMLMHTSVVSSGKQDDGTYNYDHLFKNIADQIESADIAIVNQETIMGGDSLGFSGYPTFNSPTALADAEAAAGFDVILHGTNHALDKGATALLNCIDYWETNYPDIAYLGINKSQEAQDNYIYVYEQGGISVAILNYTYGTNGIETPSDQPYLVNYLDEDKVVSDIERAHELADFVIVCPHWGTEYNLGTDSSQAKWTQIFLEAGVDLVIGTHPHVIEPVEWVTDDEGNEMLVYYSLGNYVNGTSSSGAGVTSRMVGGMASVTIGIEDGEAVIVDYDAIPLGCHIASGSDFTVYYLEDYTQELAEENLITRQDDEFSLEKCWEVVESVWGE
ncbi:MAG: CapA family protein [Clostridiales bacterium]|nr:CapA family protein [Clostridiales bacterium]